MAYDPAIDMIRKVVTTGMRCVDVGANVGMMTKELLALVGDTGKVYAFEPMPKWFSELVKLTDSHTNLVVARVALSNSRADGYMVTEDRNNLGNGGLTWQTGDEPTQVSTLDNELGGQRIDFIKIDVEGMELEVLMGGWKTIVRSKPIIMYETEPQFQIDRAQPVFRWIESILFQEGYRLFDLQADQLVSVNHSTAGKNTVALPG